LEVIPVSPNRFRPENHMGDQTYLHDHTAKYQTVLQLNNDIRVMLAANDTDNNMTQIDS